MLKKMYNMSFVKSLSDNYYNYKNSDYILKNINLFYILLNSYKNFIYFKLKKLFNFIFPLYIYKTKNIIEFSNYTIIYPKKNINYCLNKGLTYNISIKLNFLIFNYVINKDGSGINKIKLSEEKIIIPNIPLITEKATFIIDGVEKTIVSKFLRSPGIYFYKNKKGEKEDFILKIVPDFGEEINFILNYNNILFLNYKKKNIFITDILKSFGLNNLDIINNFYNFLDIFFYNEKDFVSVKFDPDVFLNYNTPFDIFDNFNEIIIEKDKIISLEDINKIKKKNIDFIFIDKKFLLNKHLGCNLYFNNIKFANITDLINLNVLNKIINYNIKFFKIIVYGSKSHSSVILTLKNSFFDYFKSLNNLNNFLNFCKFKIFNFNILNYNSDYLKKYFYISEVCRKKINFFFKKNDNFEFLNSIDIINIIKALISFKDGFIKETHTLDLNNLILQMSGEILYKIFFDFFLNLKHDIKNSFCNFVSNNLNFFLKISNLLNEIKKFFSTSRYCQYLDQLNILSEISHKRRVTFLGVIGISKKYSGFEPRELSSTHFSKLCPVETPEGINIGLVNSLALFCKVDKYNFLISPYYKILNGKILKKWNYISIDEEFSNFIIEPTMYFKNFDNLECVLSKYEEQLVITNPSLVKYMNVVPYQILSVSALLIPFIEHNDSNRALMASNMLKQALPLIYPSKPLVMSGFEGIVVFNDDNSIKSFDKSILYFLDSRLIILKNFFIFKNFYYYNYNIKFLKKYIRTNQKTIKSQRLLNDYFKKILNNEDIIIENNNTDNGNISLGKNVIVAFMPWMGYNFEDSLIVSEKIIINDTFTSLELLEIDVNVSIFSKKSEILTRNVIKNFYDVNNIDNFGIIKIGKKVYGGDIIIGKVCPIIDDFKDVNSNQRFLYALFSNNSDFNYIDTSFRLPEKFSSGTVVSNEVYFSNFYDLSKADKRILKKQSKSILLSKKKFFYFIKKKIISMIKNFLLNKKCFFKNSKFLINFKFLKKKKMKEIFKIKLIDNFYFNLFEKIKKKFKFFLKIYKFLKINIKNKFFKNLSINLTKNIKIFIISKKILSVGDKMSGRHGNKGVVSKILPVKDMPYLFNGIIIDVILNPLGVPSRMNVGQLLEIHLGFASLCLSLKIFNYLSESDSFNKIKNLLYKVYDKKNFEFLNFLNYKEILNLLNFFKNGFYFSIKPFCNFKENNINYLLNLVFDNNFLFDLGVSKNKKQVFLYDGRTGKKFKTATTVGYMYILKLNHLSEDKIHARSVGPYSMVTQQPLKGKTNKGGQRLGEMEVWALEAYGAFYSLQEMFTTKSDDVVGRFKFYKSIVDGVSESNYVNIPETFNVMIKNINSLSLYIRFNEY